MIYKTLCIDEETLDVKLIPTTPSNDIGIKYEGLTLFAAVISAIKDLWYIQQKAFDVSIDPSSGDFPVAIYFPDKGPITQETAGIYARTIRYLIGGKVFLPMVINVDFRGRLDVSVLTAVSTNSDKPHDEVVEDTPRDGGDDLRSKIVTELHNLWMLVRRDFDVIINPTANPVVIWSTESNVETEALANQCVQKIHALVRDKDFPPIQFTVYDGRVKITNHIMT